MHGLSPAPFAVLFELNFANHQLLVLAGPVVDALALRALEFDQSVLRHEGEYNLQNHFVQSERDRALAETKAEVLACVYCINSVWHAHHVTQAAHVTL
ncbi:MAG: hypothetical protein G01um101456_618 [Parcubacteria group bacterium Gr01-1014_56]|nr:MAG: hypothetical protein G01um101456_618 [Parcubacteria group bacterium Gr01-1014_56]